MINFKNGDLLEDFKNGVVNVIAHQCNCVVGMGAGIAKQIADTYQLSEILDKGFRKNGIGKCLLIPIINKKYIFNLYAQYYPGPPYNIKSIDGIYDTFENRIKWLRSSLIDMIGYLDNTDKIGLPLIASGMAKDKSKGDADDLIYFRKHIYPVINELLSNFNVTIYYL